MKYLILISALLVLAGCGSSVPVKIGADTYYVSKVNAAGAFGDPGSIAGELMQQGNQTCMSMGKEFELVTHQINPSRFGASLGGANITFKCVDHASNPVMRPDNGVNTIEITK